VARLRHEEHPKTERTGIRALRLLLQRPAHRRQARRSTHLLLRMARFNPTHSHLANSLPVWTSSGVARPACVFRGKASTDSNRKHPLIPVGGEFQIRPEPVVFFSLLPCGMRDLIVLLFHLITTVFRFVQPGGWRSVIAESILLKHQLLIVNRSRRRGTQSPRTTPPIFQASAPHTFFSSLRKFSFSPPRSLSFCL
jgi:hypothetical protein